MHLLALKYRSGEEIRKDDPCPLSRIAFLCEPVERVVDILDHLVFAVRLAGEVVRWVIRVRLDQVRWESGLRNSAKCIVGERGRVVVCVGDGQQIVFRSVQHFLSSTQKSFFVCSETGVPARQWQCHGGSLIRTALGGVLHLSESIAMRGRIGMFLISSFLQRSGRSTSPISVNPELTGARRLDGFSCQS